MVLAELLWEAPVVVLAELLGKAPVVVEPDP